MTGSSPEFEVLLQIARPVLMPANRERLRALLEGPLDWNRLHLLASRHRLGMFLFRHVDSSMPVPIPRSVYAGLWRSYEDNARANHARVAELLQVIALLEDSGVPVIAYKGPVLAAQLYADVSMREFEDLDLLVRAHDVPRAKEVLCERLYDLADAFDPAAESYMYRSRPFYHRSFKHRATGALLEMHWKTDAYFPVEQSSDAWWSRRPSITLAGKSIATFDATELLLLLCLHYAKHQGHRLGWLVEITQLIEAAAIDWDRFDAEASRLRCRRRVAIALLLSADMLGADVPPAVLARERSHHNVRLAAEAIRTRLVELEPDELQSLPRLRLNLRMFDGIDQAITHAIDVTFAPSKLELRNGWPRFGPYGYLPARLSRLARKYGPFRRVSSGAA